MENTHIADNISEVIEASRKYLESHLTLFKLELLERLSKVVSLIISTMLVLMIASLFVLFLSLTAAIFLGHLLHNMELGFLILSAFFFILLVIFWKLRKNLIINQVIESLNSILFTDNERNDDKD